MAVTLASCAEGQGATSPWADSTPVETGPMVVVLCHGSNQSWPENLDASYFEALFTETSGSTTIADYWRDISHGKFSIEGSIVIDVQLDVDRDAIGDGNDDDWEQCRDGADERYDIDWDAYVGTAVFKPQTHGVLVYDIGEDDTELVVSMNNHSVMADWSTPPFTLIITANDNGSLWANPDTNIENVLVTAASVDGDLVTFTGRRGQSEGYADGEIPPKGFKAGTQVRDNSEIQGFPGGLAVSAQLEPVGIVHEMGHLLGWSHSRWLGTAEAGYNDCFDIMSAESCVYTFPLPSLWADGAEQTHGLGMTSSNLDVKGWIDDDDRELYECGEETFSLKALGLDGPGLHQVRVPVSDEIRDGVKSEYLTIELRSQRFPWDRGIEYDAIVVHLLGDDGIPYLVDDAPGDRKGMQAGDRYEVKGSLDDPLSGVSILVNTIDAGAGTAEVTIVPSEKVAEAKCGPAGASASSTTTTPETSTTTTTAPTTTTTTTEGELAGAACVPGVWELESQAFVDSLASVAGSPGAGLKFAGGTYRMTITEEGTYASVRDGWSLSINDPEGTMTMVFDTEESGSVTWDDTTMTYAEEETSSVTDLTLILEAGGITQELPIASLPSAVLAQFPEPELMSGTATYACEDDSLVIEPDDSGVEIAWRRVG